MDFELPNDERDDVTIEGSDVFYHCKCGGALHQDRSATNDEYLASAVAAGTDFECGRCGRIYTMEFNQQRGMTEQYPVCLQCDAPIDEKSPYYACYECDYQIDQPVDEEEYRETLLEHAVNTYLGDISMFGEEIRFETEVVLMTPFTHVSDETREILHETLDFDSAGTLPPSDEWLHQQFVKLAEAGHIVREVKPEFYDEDARDEDDPIVELLSDATQIK